MSMSIYKSSARYLRDCKIKTFEEYAKDFRREGVEISDSIESIKSSDLIKLLQDLQVKYNTTDLTISTVVTDGYYETANLLIERLETDEEFNKRVNALYNYELQKHKNAIQKEENENEIANLKKQQAELQAKINALQ